MIKNGDRSYLNQIQMKQLQEQHAKIIKNLKQWENLNAKVYKDKVPDPAEVPEIPEEQAEKLEVEPKDLVYTTTQLEEALAKLCRSDLE